MIAQKLCQTQISIHDTADQYTMDFNSISILSIVFYPLEDFQLFFLFFLFCINFPLNLSQIYLEILSLVLNIYTSSIIKYAC